VQCNTAAQPTSLSPLSVLTRTHAICSLPLPDTHCSTCLQTGQVHYITYRHSCSAGLLNIPCSVHAHTESRNTTTVSLRPTPAVHPLVVRMPSHTPGALQHALQHSRAAAQRSHTILDNTCAHLRPGALQYSYCSTLPSSSALTQHPKVCTRHTNSTILCSYDCIVLTGMLTSPTPTTRRPAHGRASWKAPTLHG
jgi:hypothetical protein